MVCGDIRAGIVPKEHRNKAVGIGVEEIYGSMKIGLSLLFGILKVYRGQDGDRGELKYRLQGKDIFIGHQLRLVSRRG